jgi:hypothetical protein
MSVDYHACDCCGDALYEEFVSSCASCGRSLCTDGVVNTEGVAEDGRFMYPYDNEDGEVDPKYCPFCCGDMVDNIDLIRYAAVKYGFTIDELRAEYVAKLSEEAK